MVAPGSAEEAASRQAAVHAARRDDPVLLARFVWSVVHGVAMLTIDGQLPRDDDAARLVTRYTLERLRAAVAQK